MKELLLDLLVFLASPQDMLVYVTGIISWRHHLGHYDIIEKKRKENSIPATRRLVGDRVT
jgi:hypothetical protein